MQEEQPVSAEAFAESLPMRFVRCRELGHVWRPHTVTREPGHAGFFRKLRCAECKTTREQLLDAHGHVIRNGYGYPDGYLAGTGVERHSLSRDVFRLEAITRYLDKHTD